MDIHSSQNLINATVPNRLCISENHIPSLFPDVLCIAFQVNGNCRYTMGVLMSIAVYNKEDFYCIDAYHAGGNMRCRCTFQWYEDRIHHAQAEASAIAQSRINDICTPKPRHISVTPMYTPK